MEDKQLRENSPYAEPVAPTTGINHIAARRSRSQTALSSWIHLIPVGFSFGILQLGFRNVYWDDIGAANQNAKLAGLQVVAKLHEMLILLSMAHLVLHYARKLIVSPEGMPFGLLEATYQTALSGQPWTIGYLKILKHLFRTRKGSWRVWRIVFLLIISAILALFVGPASAITVIPQLGWWYERDLIGPLLLKQPFFSVYVPTVLFPTQITGDNLPGSFCSDIAQDINGTCPSAGTLEVQRSLVAPEYSQSQNTTISEVVNRRIQTFEYLGMNTAVIPNYLLASFTSLLSSPQYTTEVPFTVEVMANGIAPRSPLVAVSCHDNQSDIYMREYNYELGGYDYNHQRVADWDRLRRTGLFDIRAVWSEDELGKSINGTELFWRDIAVENNTSVLLALMRHQNNVTLCNVQSYWTPTTQWILSTVNYEVANNFTWGMQDAVLTDKAGSSMYGYPYVLNQAPIHIHEDWASTLNAVNGSTKVLESLIDYGVQNDAITNSSTASFYGATRLEAITAQLVAKSVANGLSRIGAQYAATNFVHGISQNDLIICNSANWCSQGPYFRRTAIMPLATVANMSREDVITYFGTEYFGSAPYYSWWNDSRPIMRTFAKPSDANVKWTRLEFPVRRYGRAWALEGIASQLSAALLCFHALIAIVHAVYRISFDCLTFSIGGSLGSLLALAMGEGAPRGNRKWTSNVMIMPFNDMENRTRLKLMMMYPTDNILKKGEQDGFYPETPSYGTKDWRSSTSSEVSDRRQLEDFKDRGKYHVVVL